jgi:membrane fusion protein (multidrug efflux system)
MRLVLFGAFLSLMNLSAAAQTPPPIVTVGTINAERKPIDKTLDFVGRIEAVERVDVRARVSGWLEDVLFKDGQIVEKDTPLYRIEDDLYTASVEQAKGALQRSKAARTLTAIQLQRAQELLNRQSGTEVARDQAKAADDQAQAQIMTDDANVKTAQINLGYTNIVSPIKGEVGRTRITRGNLVGPDSGVLTTIVSVDPMYVAFSVSQREFLRAQESSSQKGDVKGMKVRLRFADGSEYPDLGQLDFVNVTVDRTTDTILARATVANKAGRLIDGQFVRVQILVGRPVEKVVIPQSALIADQGGVYVFVVDDGKAAVRRIKPSGESGTDVVVDEGLNGGEQVIVDGLQTLRPGAPVSARPAAGPKGT